MEENKLTGTCMLMFIVYLFGFPLAVTTATATLSVVYENKNEYCKLHKYCVKHPKTRS